MNKLPSSPSSLLSIQRLSLSAFLLAGSMLSASAAATWNGGADPNGDWTNPANWGGTVPIPSATEALTFAGTAGLGNTNDFAANSQFNTLTFDASAGAFTLGGNAINLGDGTAGTKITNLSANLQTINANLALLQTGTIATGAGGIQLGGNVSGSGFGLTLSNIGGPLVLSGSNTFSGATTVNAGAGTSVLRAVANAGNTASGISSALSPNSTLTFAPSNIASNPVLQLRADANTTFQTAGVSFAGSTTARQLTINVDQDTAGNTGHMVTLGGTFTIGSYQTAQTLINVTGSNGYGLAIGNLDLVAASSSNSAPEINVSAPGGLTIASIGLPGTASSTGLSFTGVGNTTIVGDLTRNTPSRTLTLNQNGPGVLTLQGSASNIAGGGGYAFNLNSGVLNVNNANALGAYNSGANATYTRTLNLNGGTLDNTSGAAIVIQNNNAIAATTTAFVTNINGDFVFGSTNALSKALTLNVGSGGGQGTMRGYITLGTAVGTSRTITTNGDDSLTLNGGIVNGTTASSLVKAGEATLVLGKANFYTGGTTVSTGTLLVGGEFVASQSSVSGTTAATTVVTGIGSTANLRVGQSVTGANIAAGTVISGILSATSVAISQAATGSGATSLTFSAGSALGTGAVSVGVNGTLGGVGTISGPITVTGSLMGGDGSAATGTTLSAIGGVSLTDNSVIKLTLGAAGTHTSIDFTGGAVTFDGNQAFTLNNIQLGTYDNILVGVGGVDPGVANFLVTNGSGYTSTFTYDGANVDLAIVAIPEPSTLALVGVVGLALALRRGRRK